MSIRTKRIVLLVVVMLFVLIAVFVISAKSKTGKVRLEFILAPSKAFVTLNGKKVAKTSYQKPGNYKVNVSREGYKTYNTEVTLDKNNPETVVAIGLVPQTLEAQREADQYESDYKKVQAQSSKKVNEAGQAMQDKYPIMASLPYRSSIYNIEYGKTDKQEFVIQVFAKTPVTRQVALAKIRDWGYDPTNYTIQFVDLRNPFDPDLGVRDD